jgi:DNA helicase HerA-like ATPase
VFKNKHSLITGATGSGKSWFLAHLINHLASNDGHVVILDPHDEYRFLIDKNRNYEVNFFCKSLININKDENKINYLKYFLANKYLNSAILNAVLPNISPNAMQQIEEIFNEDLSQVQLKSLNIDEIIKLIMGRIKKSEAQGYINNITYKPNDLNTLTLLYYGLIERMEQLKEKGLFQSKIPSWLESKTKCIDIIQEDYSFSDYGKRIIRALIHQFLRFKAEDFLKIFIVEEAHQLLSFNNIEDKLLLSMLLREARKFNTSIIFVTQNYYDVPEELRSQFSNIIQFREPLDKDANYFQDRLCKIKLANSNVSFLLRTPDLKVD